jgi:hypothetical protein
LTIEDYGIYSIDELPENFMSMLLSHGHVGSVKYDVENLLTHQSYQIIENIVPYTFPAGNGAWDLGTGEFQVQARVYPFDHALGPQCDNETISFTLTNEEPCLAEAGTMISDHPIQCLSGGTAVIYAEQDELPVIPDGFQQLFVLTNAFSLTILDVAATPQFEVDHVGFYRIHSLVLRSWYLRLIYRCFW